VACSTIVQPFLQFDRQSTPLIRTPAGKSVLSSFSKSRAPGRTAPSAISYLRLTPHRWSAAYNNLGFLDREASLRICPVTSKDPLSVADQFNIEYRAADAAACPHLALASIIHAGVQGIEENLTSTEPTTEDLSLLSPSELAKRGFIRLPQNLDTALNCMSSNKTLRSWFGSHFVDVYLSHKHSELEHVKNMDDLARCTEYARTY